jgi:glycosyltransferase involved in cell wall biosynthesis
MAAKSNQVSNIVEKNNLKSIHTKRIVKHAFRIHGINIQDSDPQFIRWVNLLGIERNLDFLLDHLRARSNFAINDQNERNNNKTEKLESFIEDKEEKIYFFSRYGFEDNSIFINKKNDGKIEALKTTFNRASWNTKEKSFNFERFCCSIKSKNNNASIIFDSQESEEIRSKAGGWLLFDDNSYYPNSEFDLELIDIINAAKSLRLSTCFVVRPTAWLTLSLTEEINKNHFDHFLKLLLLSDVIVTPNESDAVFLQNYFIDRQSANFGPIIKFYDSLDIRRYGELTSYFDVQLRSLLNHVSNKSYVLGTIYYLSDFSFDNIEDTTIINELEYLGVNVTKVSWNSVLKEFQKIPYFKESGKFEQSSAGDFELKPPNRTDWLIISSHSAERDLRPVFECSAVLGLKVAGILFDSTKSYANDKGTAFRDDTRLFESLLDASRVFGVCPVRFSMFSQYVQSWEGKLHSAEDRFVDLNQELNNLELSSEFIRNYATVLLDSLVKDSSSDYRNKLTRSVVAAEYYNFFKFVARPKLSICISTYNRANWLELNLKNIFSQITGRNYSVEILVVDNASQDRTPEVAHNFLKMPGFRYHRNSTNVGMLGNLRVTAQLAAGEYIWILGDDDLTRSGSISKVLDVLNDNQNIALIYLNYGYSTESMPENVVDVCKFLDNYNVLEKAGPDEFGQVKSLAAKSENFFTAIYSHIYRRDHGLRSYSQDTNGRIFSTLLTCVPTAAYVLNHMPNEFAYWIGDPIIVVNSNVSWQEYGTLFELEQLPRIWDLAERMGCEPTDVDARRDSRLWLVEMMWREIFTDDRAGNGDFFSAQRVLMRLRHLPSFKERLPKFREIYKLAFDEGHPAARLSVEDMFGAFSEYCDADCEGYESFARDALVASDTLNISMLPISNYTRRVFGSTLVFCDNNTGAIVVGPLDVATCSEIINHVQAWNRYASLILCTCAATKKLLMDNGVSPPVHVVGVGVNHLVNNAVGTTPSVDEEKFNFLHYSENFIFSGTDFLLDAFILAFQDINNVTLSIIFSEQSQKKIKEKINFLSKKYPKIPEILLINDKINRSERNEIYSHCQILVAPSTAVGFNFPVAAAYMSGMPAIIIGSGGHLDYCDETSAWLIDYVYKSYSDTKRNSLFALVSPDPVSFQATLLNAFRSPSPIRRGMAERGRARLLSKYMWNQVIENIRNAMSGLSVASEVANTKSKTGWVTTWNTKCGIATYVENLLVDQKRSEFIILAPNNQVLLRNADEVNCIRHWSIGKANNNFDQLLHHIVALGINTIIIQFNYGFFNHTQFNIFISRAVALGINTIIELHSTVDPRSDDLNYSLLGIQSALKAAVKILVHNVVDMQRLKDLGLVENVLLFSHGVINYKNTLTKSNGGYIHGGQSVPLIVSFGFFLPNKGLIELIKAVRILKNRRLPIKLLMLNAEHESADSRLEIEKAKNLFKNLDLTNDIELVTKFLDGRACLSRIQSATLMVNPYQETGESASGSARYGLSAGCPTAVTPLSIFDDFGDAVYRFGGLTPEDIADGIAYALDNIKNKTEIAKKIEFSANQWVLHNDYRKKYKLLSALVKNTSLNSFDVGQKILRGAYLNTANESCSIHESGRMVYECIADGRDYKIDYFSLDMIDVPLLAKEGQIQLVDKVHGSGIGESFQYDFWIFNWHINTMEPFLSLGDIKKINAKKYLIVLEAEPSVPLKYVYEDIFDGYITLDPTAAENQKIFSFPRPLEFDSLASNHVNEIPTIGSFGFGTPGKGFELLIEAVNREFSRAIVKINIPAGAYTSGMNLIHNEDYVSYIERQCRQIAHAGVEVVVSRDYMSPKQLVEWCAANDLNVFMYTRRQSGLSATTDQAIMSGRPLLINTNDTFRHLHRYIRPFPLTSLVDAISDTSQSTESLKVAWSKSAFKQKFDQMLRKTGLILNENHDASDGAVREKKKIYLLDESFNGVHDVIKYITRLTDCVSRTGFFDVITLTDPDFLPDTEQLLESDVIIFLVTSIDTIDKISSVVSSCRNTALIIVPMHLLSACLIKTNQLNNVLLLEKRPIVPFYTSGVESFPKLVKIMLIGFENNLYYVERVISKIYSELPNAELSIEIPYDLNSKKREIIYSYLNKGEFTNRPAINFFSLPEEGQELIQIFARHSLMIFCNSPSRSEAILDLCSLAMVTERPVAFVKRSPLRHFMAKSPFVEDVSILSILEKGASINIENYFNYIEFQEYARITGLISSH